VDVFSVALDAFQANFLDQRAAVDQPDIFQAVASSHPC
jgi:hypothetical protein